VLYNVIDRSFVFVEAHWKVGKVRQIVERLQPSHVIVGHAGPKNTYYLFRASALLDYLAPADDQAPAQRVLDLDQRTATPMLDAYDDELSAPAQAVVLDEGRVIGFVDASVAPPPILKGRGPEVQPATKPVPRMLVADFPNQVAVGETHSLVVYVSADMAAGQLPFVISIGTRIDVIIETRRGFELTNVREGSILVTCAEETQPLQFKLRATAVGLGVIRIYVFAKGQSLGSVTIESQVMASASEVHTEATPKREQPLPLIQEAAPDLSLIILEYRDRDRGEPCLIFKVKTREPYDLPKIEQEYGPVPIKVEPQQHFHDFFTQIQNLPLDNARDQRNAERQLASTGTTLYRDLVPESLRTVLWALRERIHSVQIQSAEPWIPWELCKLYGRENGQIIEGPFFCEAFAMTRWLPELAHKVTLLLRRVALVVPDPALSGLAHANDERAFMLSLANSDRRVEHIPATLKKVLAALQSGEYDGWHFTCHGSAHDKNPDWAKLELEAGEALRPVNLSGKQERLGERQPLVFLNACQSSRSALSLTGIGGWAERFLRASYSEKYPEYGAAAFIGTYWKIDDQAALNFAQRFYTALLQDKKTIGEAARAARLAIQLPGDPTWLAYTVFAHPLAKVE
jgi:hypothetical protein